VRPQTGHDAAEQARLLAVTGKRSVADRLIELVCEPADGAALPTVRDFVAFEEHVEGIAGEVVPEWYQAPTFYFTNPHALIGAHDDVRVPPGCDMLDFELEVAVVVGRDAASLSAEQARDHIFGYTVLNDWSARDLQRREMKVMLGPAKGKDFASTLGPWLVTADELEPYRDSDGFLALDLCASVNGELAGQDLLSNMGWPFEELIAYASRGTEVRAGDIVELTVEGIGTVRNRVVPGLTLPPVRAARARSVPRVRKRG
jgi:2-keto-4-pentenoate hydratase/2-oxohepta-3-ene-1,7-dioic acid hydratase in catechol pathway